MALQPQFPATPATENATLTAPAVITSRANIVGTTGLTALTAFAVTLPKRVDAIVVKGKGTSLAGELFIWIFDGTTSFLYDEIDLTAVTPGTTLASLLASKSYITNAPQGSFFLATTQRLFVSVTVSQDLNVYATTGQY